MSSKEKIVVFGSCLLLAASSFAEIVISVGGPDALAGAMESVRTARSSEQGGKIVVELADGVYPLSASLVFGAADGGSPDAPVVWRAKNRGKVILQGFAHFAWKPVEDACAVSLLGEEGRSHVLEADIPAGIPLPGFRGGGCGTPDNLQEIPVSLFEDDSRLELARWPNDEFAHTGEVLGEAKPGMTTSGVFRFPDDRLDRWVQEPELWAFGLWRHAWADARTKVLKVDPDAQTLSVDPAPIGFGIVADARFYVLNALSELDRPGEWVVDRARRKIYAWPRRKDSRLRLAVADGLIRVRGASNLSFEGIVFEGSRTDALTFVDSTNCQVVASAVRKTSSNGIRATGGARFRADGCDVSDVGETGIIVWGGDKLTLTPARHMIRNCHIHHYGRVIPNYRAGISLSGVGNIAGRNLIHHAKHQGVVFYGNDHRISYNVIHDTCDGNDDAGAIYCCMRDWTMRGTVIDHNLIHMTGRAGHFRNCEAIYLDDYSSGVQVLSNVINRASRGVHVGGGQDCRVAGNLIMNCAVGVILETRATWPYSAKGRQSPLFRILEANKDVYASEMWRTRYPRLLDVYRFEDGVFAHNSLGLSIEDNAFVSCTLDVEKENWTKAGPYNTVTNNMSCDGNPGLFDYAGFDWRLKEGAVREKLGELEIGKMGLYESPNRMTPPVRFGADITPPPPFRKTYASASVRIDLPIVGALPAGIDSVATNCRACSVPSWSKGLRVNADFGEADGQWREYFFAFTPTADMELSFDTMGARGDKTLYDDFRVTGAEFSNGGFESSEGWALPSYSDSDPRASICNLEKPYGIVTAADVGVEPAEGLRMACGNDMLMLSRRIRVRAGVPVEVRFKARALPVR